MRLRYTLIIVLFFGYQTARSQVKSAEEITRQLVENLRAERYEEVYGSFSTDLRRKISADEINMMWSGFIESHDSLVGINEITRSTKDTLILTETQVDFVQKSYILQLSINKAGAICGIFFRNMNIPHTPPDYVNTLAFYELKIPVPVQGISSEGVFSVPKKEGKHPLVIIAGGSGPTDKDATSGPNKMYKDLAWALAAEGIAVYRFDKRTKNPANIDVKKVDQFTMHDEYVDDLVHIIETFSKNEHIDAKRIFIMGHSQGGFMLPYFAKTCKGIAGYIGLAANYHSLLELMPYQFEYLSDSTTRETYEALAEKCRYMSRHLKDESYDKDSCMPGLSMTYIKHMEANKPEVLIGKLKNKPVLLIQGERDYQVPPAELELWKAQLKNNRKFEWKVYPKLNHHLMEGEGKPSPAEYSKPANVPEYVPDAIATWIRKQ